MANQYDFFNLMKAGGYNPMDGGITTNQMQDFRLQGLINNMNQTNEKVDALNLPPVQEPNPQAELLKKQQKANMLIALGDLLSGRDASSGFVQRKAGFDAQKERAERQAKQAQLMKDQEEFIKNNPQYANAIKMNQLFGMNLPASEKRDSFVAKDGYRYYVDGNNERVFPGVTVTETQSEADIYKESAAKIKNIVLNEGIDSPNLTEQERDFYKNNINKQGFMSLDQAIATQMFGVNNNNNNNKTYKIVNNAYSGTSVDQLVEQAQALNPGTTREQAINELISNGIIAE